MFIFNFKFYRRLKRCLVYEREKILSVCLIMEIKIEEYFGGVGYDFFSLSGIEYR